MQINFTGGKRFFLFPTGYLTWTASSGVSCGIDAGALYFLFRQSRICFQQVGNLIPVGNHIRNVVHRYPRSLETRRTAKEVIVCSNHLFGLLKRCQSFSHVLFHGTDIHRNLKAQHKVPRKSFPEPLRFRIVHRERLFVALEVARTS